MLFERVGQVIDLALTYKNFTLAVDDELLQVVGNRLRQAEVLGLLRHLDAHTLTDSKKVINGVFTRKYDGRKLVWADFLFTEFFYRYFLNVNERPPIDLQSIFFL